MTKLMAFSIIRDGLSFSRSGDDGPQEVRNNHITKDEGIALIKFDGEYPSKYEAEFLNYIDLSREEFLNLCDRFRSPHLWCIEDGH